MENENKVKVKRVLTQEHKDKISAARKGSKWTPEQKAAKASMINARIMEGKSWGRGLSKPKEGIFIDEAPGMTKEKFNEPVSKITIPNVPVIHLPPETPVTSEPSLPINPRKTSVNSV